MQGWAAGTARNSYAGLMPVSDGIHDACYSDNSRSGESGHANDKIVVKSRENDSDLHSRMPKPVALLVKATAGCSVNPGILSDKVYS